MHREISDDTDTYLTLLDAVGKSVSLVVIQKAKNKKKDRKQCPI